MRFTQRSLTALFLVTLVFSGAMGFLAAPVQAQTPVVHAVLFYSPTCAHCHYVIEEVLPPLFEKFGDQLEVLGVDVSIAEGQALYQLAIEHLAIPEERYGVPTLVVGETVLVGSIEIPEQFPGMIEAGLANGGIAWPDLPGFPLAEVELAATNPPDASPATPATAGGEANTTAPAQPLADADLAVEPAARELDPFSYMLGLAVLVLLVSVLVFALVRTNEGLALTKDIFRGLYKAGRRQASWTVPLLSLMGIFISGYMSYVEILQVTAVCGPVGECNLVQQSAYAQLGPVPVAVVGLLGYLLLGGLWLLMSSKRDWLQGFATLGLLAGISGALVYSIYLTSVELFLLRAICLWCLTSAVLIAVMTILILEEVLPTAPHDHPGEFGE